MSVVDRLLIIILILLHVICTGQKSLIKLADQYFEAEKYHEAAKLYSEQDKKVKKDTRLLIRRGIAYYHSNDPDACIRDMEAARRMKTRDISIYKYAGLAAFIKGDYNLSAEYLKYYLRFLKQDSKEFGEVVTYIKRCGKAQKLKFENNEGFVQNMGFEINSAFDDFSPIQSPTRHNRLYFSSAREDSQGWLRDKNGFENPVTGKYAADIYFSDSESGIWSKAKPVSTILLSPQHEWIQSFSSDGSIMYYIHAHDISNGILLADTFGTEKNYFETPKALPLLFDARKGDRDLQVFSDSLIIFSSKWRSGYGGYDLYWSKKTGDLWSSPVNFGEPVNTEFDEISPFLTKNGKALYFSSDRIIGAGGLDIYKSNYNSSGKHWNEPRNMALPVNSTKDDFGLKISADGTTGFFSSDRTGGMGGKDIYSVYLNELETNQLEFTEMPDFCLDHDLLTYAGAQADKETIQIKEVDLSVKEYISTPLYYKQNEDIFTPQNIILLRRIVELMQIYPDLKVKLSGHSSRGNRRDIDLYVSAKNAEKMADYLKSKNINPDRIYIKSYGSDYPVAKNNINGIPSNLALRFNNRIDADFLNVPVRRLKIIPDLPVITDDYKEEGWDEFRNMEHNITYSIKLAETSQMYSGEAFSTEAPVMMQKYAGQNVYIFSSGFVNSITKALELQGFFQKMEICKSCEILVFSDGVLLTREAISNLVSTYPDLEYFIEK